MTKIFVQTMFLTFCTMNLFSQSFEGTLRYKINVETLDDYLSEEIGDIEDMIEKEDTITFLYSKRGDYVSVKRNEDNINWDVYINKDKVLYSLSDDSEIITALDVGIDLEEKLFGIKPSIKLLEKKHKYEEFECNIVEVEWKTGIYRYFYDSLYFKVDDPDIYKGYNYDQWYNYLKISKSLPVIIEKESGGFLKVTYSLIQYSDKKFNDELLTLPKMKEVEEMKNFYPNKRIFYMDE